MPDRGRKTAKVVSHLDGVSVGLGVGGCLVLAIDAWSGRALGPALGATVRPFLALAVVIVAGWAAVRSGVFDRLIGRLLRATASRSAIVVVMLCLTASLAGVINLDVAVVVAMPLALGAAPSIGLDPALLTLAVANTANASSFLLPTSNVTTLLVRGPAGGPGPFLAASWLGWLGVSLVSIGAWTWFVLRSAPARASVPLTIGRREWSLRRIAVDLATMFAIAVGLRAFLPAGITLTGGFAHQAMDGSLLAAIGNNLPVASVIKPGPGGPWAAILAMSIGPNLLMTGSIATVICRRFAREEGSDLSAAAFSVAGLILTPVCLAIAYVGLRIAGAA